MIEPLLPIIIMLHQEIISLFVLTRKATGQCVLLSALDCISFKVGIVDLQSACGQGLSLVIKTNFPHPKVLL